MDNNDLELRIQELYNSIYYLTNKLLNEIEPQIYKLDSKLKELKEYVIMLNNQNSD